ncbi:hypothetical protein ACFSL4_04365 [Streptomyces caeni]|uniref:Uncharacterized protein n=1 Tax=Streptomyces caeni TaxID=2307231 RepID=A0ABW4IJI6_9ACTN
MAVLALLTIAVVRRRAGTGRQPSQRAERDRLESSYLGALAAIAVFLVVCTALANHREHRTEADRPTARVDVTGFPWCWKFSCPGAAARRTVSVQGVGRGSGVAGARSSAVRATNRWTSGAGPCRPRSTAPG